jgi:hypothetical protein
MREALVDKKCIFPLLSTSLLAFLTCRLHFTFDFGPSKPRARSGTSVDQSDIPGPGRKQRADCQCAGPGFAHMQCCPSLLPSGCHSARRMTASTQLRTCRSPRVKLPYVDTRSRCLRMNYNQGFCQQDVRNSLNFKLVGVFDDLFVTCSISACCGVAHGFPVAYRQPRAGADVTSGQLRVTRYQLEPATSPAMSATPLKVEVYSGHGLAVSRRAVAR